MMDSIEVVRLISQHRRGAVVVTAETANVEWPTVSSSPDLDIPCRHVMGKASSLGLGLALALPARKIFVLDGDGSLLMNLGSLVTVANMAPQNFIHFVFENGVYRTTGGQPIPNAGRVSFKGFATAAGYKHVYEIDTLEAFRSSVETIVDQPGPTFVVLRVPPLSGRPFSTATAAEVIALLGRFRKAVQDPSG